MSEGNSEVVIAAAEGLGALSLNRPAALHALTLGMCAAMTDALAGWRSDPAVEAVLIDHAEGRGFCAGGDVRSLAASAAEGGEAARFFFFTEYRLNHLLATYPKPVVAVMDGVTMGGGVGISAPARFRVATERTVFAMPETSIGLFPDVGGGWFLPRLPGASGMWLALTGSRLKGADCVELGLATHYVDSERLPELKAALAADPASAGRVLDRYATTPGPAAVRDIRPDIDRLFSGPNLDAVIRGLQADGSAFAAETLKTLATKSPLAMKVSFRQARIGAGLGDFAEVMEMEYRVASRMVVQPDFREGVRALLVDKDNSPKWRPESLGAVSEALLDEIFAPLGPGKEWTPLV